MKLSLAITSALFLANSALAQTTTLRDADRVRLAEAFQLADAVQGCIWPEWEATPFAVLLVTADREFLVRHPEPSADFVQVAEYDSLLESTVFARDRQYPTNWLATFPAVGGIPTIVVGQPEETGKTSTFWVLTLLHEHFHQLQMSQGDYYSAVDALDLSGGDKSGMWMLNFSFPYDSVDVGTRFSEYRDALREALAGVVAVDSDERLNRLKSARDRLRRAISDADYRYFSFQLWQEGVARYAENRVAAVAAERHQPLPAFSALSDFVPYGIAADSLRRTLADELSSVELSTWKRVAFYPLGAAEALLLDAVRPGWRSRYFAEKFYLERH